MSGISAGKKLHDAGYTNFQIIEASNRIGGRVESVKLQSHRVEMGGMWIYGKGTNPVYNMAMQYNLSFTENYSDDWTVLNDAGEHVTDAADEAYDAFEQIMRDCGTLADRARARNLDDFTTRACIRHYNWRPKTPIEDAIEAYIHDYETGVDPNAHSGKYLYLEETFADFGSEDMLIVNDQRGFELIIETMAEELNDTRDRFIFNQTVEEIRYTDSGVTMTTKDDTVYNADFVIVTVSLGVLQNRLLTFSPPLPESKLFAIDKFGIAKFSHNYMKYQTSFWDDTMYLLYTTKERGKLSIWVNMNAILPGSNILQVSLFNEFASWADYNTDAEVIRHITATLEIMYPNNVVPSPSDFKISRWNTDPLYMGSFSYWPPAFTERDMEILGHNVGRVYFSGDYMHPLHYGFLHASYLTGMSAAYDVMKCVEDSTTCVKVISNDTSGGACVLTFNVVFVICLSIVLQTML